MTHPGRCKRACVDLASKWAHRRLLLGGIELPRGFREGVLNDGVARRWSIPLERERLPSEVDPNPREDKYQARGNRDVRPLDGDIGLR
jgi:hypothetical protein